MPSAEIIIIGTEILLGEIPDTNARFIARHLRDIGIDLYRITTVGDNAQRIAIVVRQAMERCDIILTTGGLGPTVDDPTREAIALSVDRELEYRPELWEQIQARFKRFNRTPTENNKRQAYVPSGALARENPVGTAPIFFVETGSHTIISLPGVPREMEYLVENTVIPYLRERYELRGIIKARVLHTAGVGESQIDDLISEFEKLSNPTVGLAAHSGQVDVRITAKSESVEQADLLIAPVEHELRQRLNQWIYGADEDTLESIALKHVTHKGWTLVVIEAGLDGELVRRLNAVGDGFRGGEILSERPQADELESMLAEYCLSRGAQVGLGVVIHPGKEKQDVHVVLISPEKSQTFYRPYGGPPDYASRWALHHSLDVIRTM